MNTIYKGSEANKTINDLLPFKSLLIITVFRFGNTIKQNIIQHKKLLKWLDLWNINYINTTLETNTRIMMGAEITSQDKLLIDMIIQEGIDNKLPEKYKALCYQNEECYAVI